MEYLIPIAIVVTIGLLAGGILTIAARFMAVEVDERVTKLTEALPGANCGACGFAGCADYAVALVENPTLGTNLCPPGGNAVAQVLSELMGVEFAEAAGKYAIMKCSGTREKTSYVMDYQGYQNCAANKLFYRGRGACESSCLGFGDCVNVCDYDALRIENGIAVVNRYKCVGCGACVKACPNALFEIVPAKTRVVVGCSSTDKAATTRQVCSIGCIGCKLCEKECKFDAIHVIDNCAVIDYSKCKNCTLCAKVCPRNVIHVYPRL